MRVRGISPVSYAEVKGGSGGGCCLVRWVGCGALCGAYAAACWPDGYYGEGGGGDAVVGLRLECERIRRHTSGAKARFVGALDVQAKAWTYPRSNCNAKAGPSAWRQSAPPSLRMTLLGGDE